MAVMAVKGIRVLSLFDGMACAYAALKRIGQPVSAYYAVELESEKWARKIAEHNHPDIKRPVDDVRLFDAKTAKKIGKIDLLVAGFPCQPFSLAGYRKGLNDKRGHLIHDTMRIISLVKPRYWLLENTPPIGEHKQPLLDIIGGSPVIFNSKFYGAQNRRRAFWANLPLVAKDTPHPACISDILLPDKHADVVAEKKHPYVPYDKPIGSSVVIIGTCHKEGKYWRNYRVHDSKGKTPATIATSKGLFIPCAPSISQRLYSTKGKCPTLTTHGGTRPQGPRILSIKDRTTYGVMAKKSKAGTLKTNQNNSLSEHANGIVRRLTVTECARLQNLPDGYIPPKTPKTRALHAIGNGMDAAVVGDIFSQLLGKRKKALF